MSYCTLPLIIDSDTNVFLKQVNNSRVPLNGGTNLSDSDFENYICHHLAQNNDPRDISFNNKDDFPTPNSLSIIDSSLNRANIISNNDTTLVNELFSMKMNYVDDGNIPIDSWQNSLGGGSKIPTDVKLFNATSSLYDSNLKIDVSLNNDIQHTDDDIWSLQFDRNGAFMNYFACINSYLSDANGDSPLYILENSANIYSLGNNPESVYTSTGSYYATHKYFTRDNSGIMVVNDISNSLDSNWCRSELNNSLDDISGSNSAYEYENNEFNTFKIIQDKPHVNSSIVDPCNNNVNIVGSALSKLPFKYKGSDISSTTFDVPNIFYTEHANWNNIGDEFQMSLTIGNIQDGGYKINSDYPFTLDDSHLRRDISNLYLTIDVQNSTHKLEISNGSVQANSNSNSGNTNFITVGGERETLEQNVYNANGEIVIYTNEVNNRVTYPYNNGVKSSLTDHVDVYYNNAENPDNITYSPNDLTTTEDVQYNIEVVTGSTTGVEIQDDNRNLAKDNKALLVLATNNSNISISDPSFVLTSSLPIDPSYIQIVSIQNKSILVDKTPVKDNSGNNVTGTESSIYVENIDLSQLNYENYRVVLTTKTVTDVSNILQLNNRWSLSTTDPSYPYIVGNISKTGVIRDDYLFMTNASDLSGQKIGLDISMTYTFEVASPIITSTQAVKHRIAISFYDLANNTTYDLSQTVFYLDDQDITLNDISYTSPVEDPSCSNIIPSSLNTGSYSPSNYIFKKFTSTKQFTASFDSKFNFYENLLFVTPLITQTSEYYQIYDLQGTQLPSYLLKYFQCADDNHLLSNTHIYLDNDYNVTFDLTQKVLSILNVQLYGTTDDVNYQQVDDIVDFLDPFFNLQTTIKPFDGENATGTINVQFNNGIVDLPGYYIDMDNKPGVNMSFNAKRYIYTVGTRDPVLTNFSYYNDFYNNLTNMTTCNVDVSLGDTNVLTVYDGTTSNVLLTIEHSSTFNNNYNVIVCSWPLLEITNSFNTSNVSNVYYSLAVSNVVQVDNGVYYHINTGAKQGDSETFNLVSDRFTLKFCNSVDFSNNNPAYINETTFTESNIDTSLNCTQAYAGNQTKSVTFSQLRGYYHVNGGDVIRLVRTPSTAVFKLKVSSTNEYINDTIPEKSFGPIYVGKSLTVDYVSDNTFPQPNKYYFDLSINITESIISDSGFISSGYIIDATVANYSANVDRNPYYPEIILNNNLSYGYITDPSCADVFYPYIQGVKPSCIKSYGSYKLKIIRNVPELHVYSLKTNNYIGNPYDLDTDADRTMVDTVNTVWNHEGDISYNNFLWGGYSLSNLKVRRIASEGKDANGNGHVVFYNNYYSYYVIAPPSISVYGYNSNTNIQSLPISGQTSHFFYTYDIDNSNNYIDMTNANNNELRFFQENPYKYAHYLYHANEKYYFNIEGNYINIAIYGAGVDSVGSGSGDDPILVDTNNNNRLETIYNGRINQISGNYFTATKDSNLNYDICYNQILLETNSHNSTPNVYFSISNAFVAPNVSSGNPTYYLRLKSPLGTTVSFYQANVIYNDFSNNNYYSDISGIADYDNSGGVGYYLILDRYDANPSINYNDILKQSNVRELFFPVSKHYVKEIHLGSIVDANGYPLDQETYLDKITLADISNADWVQDTSFSLQYIGLTMTSLSQSGTNSVCDLLKYDAKQLLQSKALYVKLQDAIRLKNVLGNNLYRVTHSGTIITRSIVTSKVSLYSPSTNLLPNVNTNIGGSSDIITYFAQNSIGI